MPTRFAVTDAAPLLPGTARDHKGFLVARAFVARSGIQEYAGWEVGDERPVVRVWRPEDEVKAPASVNSYAHAPVTMGHPDVLVDPTNVRDLQHGEVSMDDAEWIDGKLRLTLLVKSDAAQKAVEDGTARELSAGYLANLEWTSGTTPDGQTYDAIQRGIVVNHVALVPRGRAGIARIGDGAPPWGSGSSNPPSNRKGDSMSDALKTVVLGDKAVQATVADAPAIEAYRDAQAKALADKDTAHAAALAEKDATIGELKAKVADAEKAKVSDADLDRMVAERAELVATVKAIAKDAKVDGLSPAELRKAAVEARYGADAVKDASEAEIAGMFRIAAKDAKPDPVRDGFSNPAPKAPTNDAEREAAAHRAYVDGLNPRHEEAA